MILCTPINTDDHDLKLRLKNIVGMTKLGIDFFELSDGVSRIEVTGGMQIERERYRLLLEIAITTYYLMKGVPE